MSSISSSISNVVVNGAKQMVSVATQAAESMAETYKAFAVGASLINATHLPVIGASAALSLGSGALGIYLAKKAYNTDFRASPVQKLSLMALSFGALAFSAFEIGFSSMQIYNSGSTRIWLCKDLSQKIFNHEGQTCVEYFKNEWWSDTHGFMQLPPTHHPECTSAIQQLQPLKEIYSKDCQNII